MVFARTDRSPFCDAFHDATARQSPITGAEPHEQRWQIPFFAIWTGQQFSLVSSSLVQFALQWWLTDAKGSATLLVAGTPISLLPNVLLEPLVGAFVDCCGRRKVAEGVNRRRHRSGAGTAIGGSPRDTWVVRIRHLAGGLSCAPMGGFGFLIPSAVHVEDGRPSLLVTETVGLG